MRTSPCGKSFPSGTTRAILLATIAGVCLFFASAPICRNWDYGINSSSSEYWGETRIAGGPGGGQYVTWIKAQTRGEEICIPDLPGPPETDWDKAFLFQLAPEDIIEGVKIRGMGGYADDPWDCIIEHSLVWSAWWYWEEDGQQKQANDAELQDIS